ncbi:fumarylacetoacetate hydrolase family protein [Methylobacterium oryzae CBMB20]
MAPETTPAGAPPSGMPRDMVLLNMRRGDGYALGVKTKDGVLDVEAAGRALGDAGPADMDDLLQNGRGPALRALSDAVEAAPDGRFMLAESGIAYAPVVTRPEKIIMMGFNYRHHAEETGTPIPKAPPLFNKYNNALNHHGGTIALPTQAAREFDHETELVMVFGRECRNVSEADALDYLAGYCTGNDFSARDLRDPDLAVHDRQDLGRARAARPLPGDRRPGEGPEQSQAEDAGERPGAPGLEHRRHDLQLPPADQLRVEGDDPEAGGHLLHRDPAGVIFGEKIPRKDRAWLKPGDEVVSELEGLGELRFRLV